MYGLDQFFDKFLPFHMGTFHYPNIKVSAEFARFGQIQFVQVTPVRMLFARTFAGLQHRVFLGRGGTADGDMRCGPTLRELIKYSQRVLGVEPFSANGLFNNLFH